MQNVLAVCSIFLHLYIAAANSAAAFTLCRPCSGNRLVLYVLGGYSSNKLLGRHNPILLFIGSRAVAGVMEYGHVACQM